ncbi:hypothetical protein LTR66_009216 [Elasticomyces elasticus]|nr:hypothetical protein LTR66_009216 [Elasticomyces elasticus]KAK4991858.1 hypothetical protein LTR50_001477 [Elasticomyces elasticus]
MKQRVSSLDVKVSPRLLSIRYYQRIFLLKFAKPDHREQLLIDSGFRCHFTSFARATAAAPSAFVARLRKYLRTRRVTSVSQVGTDRIIELQFSDGLHRLFLEFYAGGNIVLTDSELTITALLRNVSEGAEHEQYKLGLKYNLDLRQNYGGVPPLTKERLRDGLQKAVYKQQQESSKINKKLKRKAGDTLRKALAVSIPEYPPVLLEHALRVKGYNRDLQPEEVLGDEGLQDALLDVLEEAGKVVSEITSAETAKGYIVAKKGKSEDATSAPETNSGGSTSASNLIYDDFHPFKPRQLEDDPTISFLEFSGFNKTLDEFFSSIEGQKLESRLQEREDNAKRKLGQARQEHAKRIGGLQQVQELNVRKAQAIESNLDRVEEATAAVNGLIAQGMDWVEIAKLIEMEQARYNPVAETIKLPLKLYENTVTLLLAEYSYDDEDDFEGNETDSELSDSDDENKPSKPTNQEDKRLAIDIDLALSGWSNARQYYDQKRSAAVKEEKTQQASQKALKSTEQKITADLKRGLKQEKEVLRPVRKQMWFEKFIYFLSSDGYLVLGGKDAQQNEILYRRYLKKGDVYVHADLHGAASVIIKNNLSTPDAPIPPQTLSQAGNLSVCTSSAWDSKAVMSAWWVNSDQVSKMAPTGEYLATGGFMIRGKKNFLPPAQLLLGFAVMWQISEESKARHVKHRLRDDDAAGATTDGDADGEDIDNVHIDTEEGSDEELPDAKLSPAEDSNEEFPDVKTDLDDSSSDGEGDDKEEQRKNPLQSNATYQQPATTEDQDTEHAKAENDDVAGSAAEGDAEGQPLEAADEPADGPGPEDIAKPSVRHLTPHERKLQRRGKQSSSAAPSLASSDEAETVLSTQSRDAKAHSSQPNKAIPRGKRTKAKKAAQKYADQSEEDRTLAMQLLGSRAAADKQAADEAAAQAKQETIEQAKQRRREQHERAQKQGLEAEEMRRLNLDEGVEELDEEDAAQLAQLDSFVGAPMPGDEILEAIPVCAPWAALGKYKYKAKIQPGAMKKGKVVREVLGKWIKDSGDGKKVDEKAEDAERIWPREAELIKAWKEVEVVGVMPVSKCRVMMAGGSAWAAGEKGKASGKGTKSGRGGRGSKRK